MKKAGKIFSAALLSAIFCTMFGCAAIKKYTIDDVRSISMSCGHMDYSYSYSFYLRKEDSGWLLDADFAEDTQSPHTEYEGCPVAEEDVKKFFNIISGQDVIGKLRRYKEPKIKVYVSDETTYVTSVLFSDGKRLSAKKLVSSDAEEGFYRLAKEYADAIGNKKTDNIKTELKEEQKNG